MEESRVEGLFSLDKWSTNLPVHMHVMTAEIQGDKELEEYRVRRIRR